jgi:hypothetical protein
MKTRPRSLARLGWAATLLLVAGCGESTPDKPTAEQAAPNYGPESAKKLMEASKALPKAQPGVVPPGGDASKAAPKP